MITAIDTDILLNILVPKKISMKPRLGGASCDVPGIGFRLPHHGNDDVGGWRADGIEIRT